MAEVKYLDYAGLQKYDGLIKQWVRDYHNAGLPENVESIEAWIESLEEKIGDLSSLGTDVQSLAEAILGEIQRVDDLEERIEGAESAIDALVGDDTKEDGTPKSVREIAVEALAEALIPEDAKEALDTLEEIAAWIQEHPEDAADMNQAISDLEDSVSALETIIGAPAKDEEPATGIYKEIADGDKALDTRLDAVEAALGLVDPDVEGDKSLAEKVADLEQAISDLDTYVAITDAEIEGLFEPTDKPE